LVAEPNPDQQVVTSKPASASPVRAAVPAVQPNPDEQVPAGAPASRGVPIPAGYGTVGPPRVIVRVSAPSGFDWGDAGIGAASGIGVSMLGFAAALAVSQRRTRHQRDAAAATS
jgi:hypothetical protein